MAAQGALVLHVGNAAAGRGGDADGDWSARPLRPNDAVVDELHGATGATGWGETGWETALCQGKGGAGTVGRGSGTGWAGHGGLVLALHDDDEGRVGSGVRGDAVREEFGLVDSQVRHGVY